MKQIAQKHKITALLMVLCMVLTMLYTVQAVAASSVEYLDYNDSTDKFESKTQDNPTIITSEITTLTDGCYVVDGTVEISSCVTVSGDVHLILKDGCTLNCTQGIIVSGDNSLTIYGQKNGTGTLNATGQAGGYPGIGAGSGKVGTIVINGGVVNATGSFDNWVSTSGGVSYIGAGIGGASHNSGSWTTGGTVVINGGQVTANGSSGWSSGSTRIAAGIHVSSFSTGTNGNAFIKTNYGISDKSNQTAWSGIIFEGSSGTVYGNQKLAADLEIESGCTFTVFDGATLTVPDGVTLTNRGTLNLAGGDVECAGSFINNGTLNVETESKLSVDNVLINIGAATVDGTVSCGSIQNSGTIRIGGDFTCNGGTNTGLIYNTGTLTNNGTISGENGYIVSTTTVNGADDQLLNSDVLFYMDEKGEKKFLSPDDAIYPLSATDQLWKKQNENTWYVVTKDLTIDGGVKLEDDVNLLLMDGVTLTVNGKNDNGGINAENHTLNIYAQSCDDGMGKLVATGGHYNWMAIGGSNAVVNIYGGFIEAGLTGGNYSGIGSGIYRVSKKITVTRGVVKTTGIGMAAGYVGNNTEGLFAPKGSGAVIYTQQTAVENSKVTGFNGVLFLKKDGSVYGEAELAMNLTVESDETLTIPAGTTLTIPAGITLTVNGKLDIEGTLVLKGTLVNNGTINDHGNHDFANKKCRFCGIEGYTQEMTVNYSVAPTYTVTIPASVTLGETAEIKAENVVIEKGKQVEVKLSGDAFKLTSGENAEINYTVTKDSTAVGVSDTVLTVNPDDSSSGSVMLNFIAPSDFTYAGIYTGTVTFTVSVENE